MRYRGNVAGSSCKEPVQSAKITGESVRPEEKEVVFGAQSMVLAPEEGEEGSLSEG